MIFNFLRGKKREIMDKEEVLIHDEMKHRKKMDKFETSRILAEERALQGSI